MSTVDIYKVQIVGANGALNGASAAVLGDATVKPTTIPFAAWLVGFNGVTGDLVRVQSFRKDMAGVTITTIASVWVPIGGKRFRLMGGSFSVSAVVSVLFEDQTAGVFVWRTPKLLADTPYNFDLGNGYLGTSVGNILKATASAAAVIT